MRVNSEPVFAAHKNRFRPSKAGRISRAHQQAHEYAMTPRKNTSVVLATLSRRCESGSKRPADDAFDRLDVGGSANSNRSWQPPFASILVADDTPDPSNDSSSKDSGSDNSHGVWRSRIVSIRVAADISDSWGDCGANDRTTS